MTSIGVKRKVLTLLPASSQIARQGVFPGVHRSRRVKRKGYTQFARFSKKDSITHLTYRGANFMPLSFSTQFVYPESFAETTVGGFIDWVYRGNSVYDPYTGGGGNSYPVGYTAFINLYERFCVKASKIEVEYVNNDTDDPVDVTVVPMLTDASFNSARFEDTRANPYARNVIVTNQAGKGRVTNYMTTAKIFGYKTADDTDLSAATTSAPSQQWYWHLVISNQAAATLAGVVYLKITYYVEFTRLKQFGTN